MSDNFGTKILDPMDYTSGKEILDEEDEKSQLISDEASTNIDSADLYERTVLSCGFGKFQVILLFVCGWALASDSVEIQVVSFVIPSACDLSLTSSEKGWLNAIIFVGMMFGGYLFGGAADIKGRRFILIWSMTINGVFGFASSFAPTFPWFLILRFLSGLGVGAAMPILFSYFVEFLPKERRGPMIGFVASFWMLGNIITSGIAWLVIPHIELGGKIHNLHYGSWRIFVAICSIPALTSAMFIFLMPESPKYLQKVGKYESATEVFASMFKMNNGSDTQLPREIKEFRESYEYRSREGEESEVVDADMCTFCRVLTSICNTMSKVFQTTLRLFEGQLRWTTLVLLFVWFTLSFGYYGLWMWFPEIFQRIQHGGSSCGGGDIVVNVTHSNMTCEETVASDTAVYFESFIVALSNLPGNAFTILVINKMGRRLLLALSMALAGISVFFFWLVETRTEMIVMSCVFSGLSISGWNSLDAVALENYPTHLRSTAFGVQAGVGRIAAILGNVVFGQLVDVHCSIPLLLVAALLFAGGLTVFKLPKTDQESLN